MEKLEESKTLQDPKEIINDILKKYIKDTEKLEKDEKLEESEDLYELPCIKQKLEQNPDLQISDIKLDGDIVTYTMSIV